MANIYSVHMLTADGTQPFAGVSSGLGARPALTRFINVLRAWESGATRLGTNQLVSRASEVIATGTVTCASVLAADTVTIGGVVFTAVTGAPAANQFDRSGTDTATATSLAAAINASVTAGAAGAISASSSVGVVTITATQGGSIGNAITLTSSNARLTVSGARLSGGAETLVNLNF